MPSVVLYDYLGSADFPGSKQGPIAASQRLDEIIISGVGTLCRLQKQLHLTASAIKLQLAQLEQMLQEEARDAISQLGGLGLPRQQDERRGPSGDQGPALARWTKKAGGVRGPSHSHGPTRGWASKGRSKQDCRRVTVAFGLEAALALSDCLSRWLCFRCVRKSTEIKFVNNNRTYLKTGNGAGRTPSICQARICRPAQRASDGYVCSDDLADLFSS